MNRKKKILLAALLCLALLIALALAVYHISRSRTFQFFGGIVNRVETTEKVVALTFDDGPTEQTEGLVEILAELDVKATFFLVGGEMEQNPQWAQALAEAGHQLGNHSYSHSRMVLKGYGWVADEIEETDALIRQAGYEGDIQFRPPNGKKLFFLPLYLHRNDRRTILWTLEPNSDPEVDADADRIVQHVLDNIVPGAIILLHPMYEGAGATSRAAIPGIVEGLRAQGYRFVTVNELLALGTAQP